MVGSGMARFGLAGMARTVRCGVFGRGMAGMSGSGAVSWGEVCYGEVGFVWARHGSHGE